MNYLMTKMKLLLKPYLKLPKEIYIVFFAKMINSMGALVFPLMTFILTSKIGLSKSEAGLWISISGLVFGPAGFIGGKITDIIGRKKLIIIFDTLGALTYVLTAFTEPTMNMIYLIMLAGFFMGIAFPAHDALIADLTTPENRSEAYSLSYLGFNIGFMIGPVLGGLLIENYLWLVFIIDAFTALLAVILVALFIGETFEKIMEDFGEDRKEEQRVDGSIFKVLFTRPILIYFSLASFGFTFVYSQWTYMLPLHVKQNFVEEGFTLYGQIAGFNGFIVMVFTPILTLLFVKKKNIRKIIYGGILYTLGFGMLGFLSTKMAFFLSAFIFTLGEILITVSTTPYIVNHTPASHRGRMNSILPLIISFGFTTGPIVMGKVIEIITIETAWRYIGLIMLSFTIIMLFIEKLDNKYEAKLQFENLKPMAVPRETT